MKTFIILVGLFTIIIVSYITVSRGFYEYTKSDFDLWRIPLIKPYEIHSTSGGDSWSIMYESPMHFEENPIGVGIDSINIARYLILMYASSSYNANYGNRPAWLIYDCKEKVGFSFNTSVQFKNILRSKYNVTDIKFYSVHQLFNEYNSNLKLPTEWAPYVLEENKKRWWDIW